MTVNGCVYPKLAGRVVRSQHFKLTCWAAPCKDQNCLKGRLRKDRLFDIDGRRKGIYGKVRAVSKSGDLSPTPPNWEEAASALQACLFQRCYQVEDGVLL